MKALKDVIQFPLMSEKTTLLRSKANQYVFKVAVDATKPQIKQAIESRFEVMVEKVNTIKMAGKVKKSRGLPGRRPAWKKAVIRLRAGDTIKEIE